MLDDAQVNVGTLLFYVGLVLGVGLLIAAPFTLDALSPFGVAVIVVTCAHGLRRAIVVRDEAMRAAFEVGRDHERGRLESVKSR